MWMWNNAAALSGLMILAVACATSSCATVSADIAYAVPVEGHDGDEKWVLEARAATGGVVKLGAAVRSKLGSSHHQLAIAPELTLETATHPVNFGVRLGMHLFQLDSQDGEWTAGAGTPYIHPLLMVRVGHPMWVFLGGTLEYEIHSGDGPSLWYAGVQVGVGIDL